MIRPERTVLDETRTTLAVAVKLTDAFTDGRPRVPPRVRLAGRSEPFIRTPSGFAVLTDPPEGTSSVTLAVDGDPRYLPERRKVQIDPESSPQVETIDLLPSPAYRFPAGTTLVRGSITANGDPVASVDVGIVTDDVDAGDEPSFTAAGRSDVRGEYAMFVRGITDDDVRDGYDGENDRVVHVRGEKPIIRAHHSDTEQERRETVAMPEGATTRLDLDL